MELMNYELPEELAPFEEKLLATRVTFVEVIPGEEQSSKPWQSFFGGNPYLPLTAQYPTTPDGEPLFFLAQINFEEVPSFPPFPAKGILQFFIWDDGLYGQPTENPREQHTFRVVYYPEVIKDPAQLVRDFSFLPNFSNTPIYPNQSYPMHFGMQEEIVPTTDYAFQKIMGNAFFAEFGEAQWELWEAYDLEVSAEGHKLGGYAHFAQEDPRSAEEPWVLLFQMDSDTEIECNWGDMGTAHFFIAEEDLKKADFSKVIFHWDCH